MTTSTEQLDVNASYIGHMETFENLDEVSRKIIERQQSVIVQQQHEIDILRQEVRHDKLSGLFNKAALHGELEKVLEKNKAAILLIIDVDRFKQTNDTLGHSVGDSVLAEVGNILRETFQREKDILIPARVGGDEFASIIDLSGYDNDNLFKENERNNHDVHEIAHEMITRIMQKWDAYIALHPELAKVRLGLSIGYAISDPKNPLDATELYHKADESMYEVKRGKASKIEKIKRNLGMSALKTRFNPRS